MPYCANCGTDLQPSARSCQNCGKMVAAEPVTTPVGVETAVAAPEVPFLVPAQRIVLMTILTYGFYIFYWAYQTWRHYRDHTKAEVFPVWHALALLVPVYSLFRWHAHVRTFKELMAKSGVPTALSIGWALAGFWVSSSIDFLSLRLTFSDQADKTALAAAFLLDLVSMGIVVWLLTYVQSSINAYWRSLQGVKAIPTRTSPAEIVLAIVGILVWLVTIVDLTA